MVAGELASVRGSLPVAGAPPDEMVAKNELCI